MVMKLQVKFLLMCGCILAALSAKGVDGQCTTPPTNLAVYEGTKNISMMCGSPTKVSYTLRPTTDEITAYKVTNYDDVVLTSLKNLFGVDSSSLLIKTGQGVATVAPISTAGLYVILINGSTTKYGAKLTVVRQPPTCNCTTTNSTKINMTCSLSYADSVYHPINANMNWTADGNFYKNDTPVTQKVGGYSVSTSIITVDSFYAANYQCTVTFGKPTKVALAYVATNAPAFSASCTPPFCGDVASAPPTSTTQPPTTQPPTTQPPTTQPPTTQPPAAEPPTSQPPAAEPPTSQPPAAEQSTTQPPATDLFSATPSTGSPPPGEDCSKTRQCQPEYGTDNTGIYMKSVVRAQLYTRSDKCCSNNQTCGVVVTLQYGNRYLIHDAVCNDNGFNMAVVAASCMSSDWKLVSERSFVLSNVGAFVLAGNIAQIGSIIIPSIQSCNAMMSVL